jgi:hypothetical protein
MVIDGTYLSIFPPVAFTGSEAFGSDVVIPGAAITLSDADAKVNPIRVAQDINSGLNMLNTVEESIAASSQDPILSGQNNAGSQTAYEISKIEQNANTVLGLFVKMISFYVKAYGNLRLDDILQYLTIGEVAKIEGNDKLVYKTFLVQNKNTGGKNKTRKISFDANTPDAPISGEEAMIQSFEILKLEKEGGNKVELYKVNPKLFRDLKYELKISPDVLQPTTEELERAYLIEQYDRMIANPMANQKETFKLLLSAYPKTKIFRNHNLWHQLVNQHQCQVCHRT